MTKLSSVGEISIINLIRESFHKDASGIIVGMGDDAAVIDIDKEKVIIATDMLIEGIHFDLRLSTPFQIGYKTVAVNVSDINAMGGKPKYFLLGLALPEDYEKEDLDRFLDGVKEAAGQYRVILIGGDTSASRHRMAISGVIIGAIDKKPILRSGARPGDRIYVTGTLGDSAIGLEILKRYGKCIRLEEGEQADIGIAWELVYPPLKRHLMPEPRNAPDTEISAMIDISDGLLTDISHICDESNVGARIHIENIPLSDNLKEISSTFGIDLLPLALSGGEDYELLFTARNFKGDATYIGDIIPEGRFLAYPTGREIPFKPEGYEHFH